MCGIGGQAVRRGGRPDVEAIARMTAAQVHRGPDSAGMFSTDDVAIGMRRLSIIGVATGDQPISSEDGDVTVVCNGEIYNFQELRQGLEARGHRFSTGSDVEVIVHLYEERGADLVEELRGMFAFALWDATRHRLVLARDRVGKKPLYYFDRDGAITFASELAPLLEDRRIARRVDPQALDAYLALLYVPGELSAIDGVRRLPPASVMVWEDGHAAVVRYWTLDYSGEDDVDEDEAVDQVRDALRDAVAVRLISERPLGVFLSGGVDSAAIVATMAELGHSSIRTFSIGFGSDRFNELPFARLVAERYGTVHTEEVVEPDALAVLPKLITHYGEPFGDSSAIPSYHVARLAACDVTVALNGDGGDESFGGYNRYAANRLAERLELVPAPARRALAAVAVRGSEPSQVNSGGARVKRLLRGLPLQPHERYAASMTYCSEQLREELYTADFRASIDPTYAREAVIGAAWRSSSARDVVHRMLDVDVRTYLPGDLLVKMDIATMANSLEARSPFLDHRLMELTARLPASLKVSGTATKVLLKRAMRDLVPEPVLGRPKSGFAIPLAEWVRGPLREAMSDVLLERRTRERGVVRPEAVGRMLDAHLSGRSDQASPLWLLFILELWQRRFVDGEPESSIL